MAVISTDVYLAIQKPEGGREWVKNPEIRIRQVMLQFTPKSALLVLKRSIIGKPLSPVRIKNMANNYLKRTGIPGVIHKLDFCPALIPWANRCYESISIKIELTGPLPASFSKYCHGERSWCFPPENCVKYGQ